MASFLLIEAASRLWFFVEVPYFLANDGLRQSITKTDNSLHHKMKENLNGRIISPEYEHRFITNSLGFRSNFEYQAPDTSSYRIMSLGDNFAVGIGVELQEAYAECLANLINQVIAKSVTVWNLGVASYGTLQAIELFKRYAFYQPNLVVLGFFARDAFASTQGNDLVDNYKFFKFVRNGRNLGTQNSVHEKESVIRKIRFFLTRNFNSYRLFEYYANSYLRKNYDPSDNAELREAAW